MTLSDGSTILTRCVVWGGGLKAAPIAAAAGLPQGKGGRIDVEPDLTVPGFPGVLVIGDIANIPNGKDKTHPQLGSVALQSGHAAADTIIAQIDGRTAKPFHYRDKGTMAMIGRGAAIAQVPPGIELHGKVAFAAWLGVHAALMTGGSNRVDAFKSWAEDFFGKERAPQALDRSGTPRMRWEEDEAVETAATQEARHDRRRTSTSSSSAAAPAAARWPVISPRPASGSCSSSVATGCRARSRTGTPTRCSSRTATCPKDTWYDEEGKGFQPGIHYYVGGQTKFYGAALYRLRPRGLRRAPASRRRSPPPGRSPTTSSSPTTPRPSSCYEVHGARGEDPTEPPSSAPYPFPAVTHEPRIQQLSDDLVRAGYHPFHAPCGVRLLEDDIPNSICIRCTDLRRLPVLVQGKSDAEIFGVRPALAAPERHAADQCPGDPARDRRRRARP